MATKPAKTVNQAKRPQRELIALKDEPRYQVPRDDPGWFAQYMREYTDGLRQTLERMQERIEQLEGHRGNPEIQADLSMLGNAIKDVKDPALKDVQNVVTVKFLVANALVKNAQGEYVLNGTLNANGQVITNMGRSRFSFDPQTTAEILALILATLTTNPPTTVRAGDTPVVGVETKGARGDHRHGVSTGDAADLVAIQAGDTSAGGSSLDLPRADHRHGVSTTPAGTLSTIQAGDGAEEGTSQTLPRGDHQHPVETGVDGDLSRIDSGDAAGAGTSTRIPRADHQHPVNTEGGGSLSTIQAGDTADAGVATTLPRGDHQHPVSTAVVGEIAAVADTAAAGAATSIPRGDHVHRGVNYDEGTFTITGTGFTVNPTGTARWEKHRNLVLLILPTLTGTSNAATFTLTALPAAIQPTQTSWPVVRLTNNGTDAYGLLRLNSGSTTIDVFATAGAGVFTGAGTKTLYPCVVAYALL